MPIYEFKCLECGEFNELLFKSADEKVEMSCKKCSSSALERVLSTTNYAMGAGGSISSGVTSQSRQCSGGSCTTYDIPGHSR